MKSKKEIAKIANKNIRTAQSALQKQYTLVKESQAFYAGNILNYQDELIIGANQKQKNVQINLVIPYVNAVAGFMAQNRRKAEYQARVVKSELQHAYSDAVNGAADYFRENANADQVETRQDLDVLIGGYGVIDHAVTLKDGSATRDPNGEIVMERVNPLHVGWDHLACAPNLIDRRFEFRAKDYPLEEAKELFDAEDDDFEGAEDQSSDTTYSYYPNGGIVDKVGMEYADPDENIVRVYFYSWYEVEPFYKVDNPLVDNFDADLFSLLTEVMIEQDLDEGMFSFDPQSPELVMTKEIRPKVKALFEEYGVSFNAISGKRKVFYTAILSGDKVFDTYKSPSQQSFSMQFKTANFDEVNKVWFGLVQSMKDPARYYNKALTELLVIIASNSKGGILYESDAVESVQHFERQWLRHNAAIRLAPGAISQGKIREKATPQMNTGYEGIIDLAANALPAVTGIDKAFMGSVEFGNETAALHAQRIKRVMASLAIYFDALTLFQKEQARLFLDFIRLLVNASKSLIYRIMTPEGAIAYQEADRDAFFSEYDVTIAEAPTNPMQKEQSYTTLMQLGDKYQMIGDVGRATKLYSMASKYTTLDPSDKSQVISMLNDEPQVDPAYVQQLEAELQALKSQAAELQMQKTKADVGYTQARTEKERIEAQKKNAETLKAFADVEAKETENELMRSVNIQDVNVTI